jgi:predicted metalloprotease with PDZ domain
MKKTLLASSLLLGAVPFAHADVDYQLRIANAAQHLAEVRATFPAATGNTLDVQMPNWRTGRYQMLNLANGVRQFKAVNDKGQQLPVAKTDKGTWRVQTRPGDKVTVVYELYANVLGERTRHIDDTHAYLDASGVFVYAAPYRAEPVKVTLDVPQGWQSRSGMDGCGAHCFSAKNYDVLIDSPIETGIHDFYTPTVDGKTIEVAIWGRGNYDGQKMTDDLKKIVAEGGKLYQNKWPFQRYLFIVHATDGAGGATEHINSTVIQRPRWMFGKRKDYLGFLRTAAHEFFHTWNVKAYRPKEMVPYDYQNENYNPLLWIAEGHTSYFDELIVLRAGLQKRDEFMEEYAKLIDDMLHQPGRFQQSASESSFDEWIAGGGAERARNASVNIYTKGQVLGLMMDIELRKQTKGAKGLEDVHRVLYAKNSVAQGGYTPADVRAALKEVSGQDWSGWWSQYVDGTAEVPFDSLLKAVGMQFLIDVPKDEEQKQVWWSGWKFKDGSDPAQVTEVERDSPAWKAGVVSGDTLLAVNGIKVSAKDVTDRMALAKAGPFKLHLFRRDELREAQIEPVLQPNGKPKVKALENVSAEQKSLNAAWLGVAWPKEEAKK